MQAMEMVTGRLIDSAQCTEIRLKQLGIGLRVNEAADHEGLAATSTGVKGDLVLSVVPDAATNT